MINETEAEIMVAQQRAKIKPQQHPEGSPDLPDKGPENALQRKAEDWLNERGYPYIHDRSRKKNKKGKILDLHIYLPKGRHVVIEFKVVGNKMSDEQKETYQKIHFLGHEIEEVRSYKRFLEIMNGAPTTNMLKGAN